MAYTVDAFETNKNAVIIQYSTFYGPSFDGDKPIGCVVRYFGFFIRTSIYEKGFRVFKPGFNISKKFSSLNDAKKFIIQRFNKSRTLFDEID